MKLKLIFEYTMPDDYDEHKIQINAEEYYMRLIDIKATIRSIRKHEEISEETEMILDRLAQYLPEDI